MLLSLVKLCVYTYLTLVVVTSSFVGLNISCLSASLDLEVFLGFLFCFHEMILGQIRVVPLGMPSVVKLHHVLSVGNHRRLLMFTVTECFLHFPTPDNI